MRLGALRGDFGLLRSGLSLGWSFGVGSLEELARTALALENGIYRAGSLRPVGDRLEIQLDNPPLRIGAFRAVALTWDGSPVPPERLWVATDRRPELRAATTVGDADPLELETGEGSRYAFQLPVPPSGSAHRLRLEWHSRAVPPRVWLELTDRIHPGGPG